MRPYPSGGPPNDEGVERKTCCLNFEVAADWHERVLNASDRQSGLSVDGFVVDLPIPSIMLTGS